MTKDNEKFRLDTILNLFLKRKVFLFSVFFVVTLLVVFEGKGDKTYTARATIVPPHQSALTVIEDYRPYFLYTNSNINPAPKQVLGWINEKSTHFKVRDAILLKIKNKNGPTQEELDLIFQSLTQVSSGIDSFYSVNASNEISALMVLDLILVTAAEVSEDESLDMINRNIQDHYNRTLENIEMIKSNFTSKSLEKQESLARQIKVVEKTIKSYRSNKINSNEALLVEARLNLQRAELVAQLEYEKSAIIDDDSTYSNLLKQRDYFSSIRGVSKRPVFLNYKDKPKIVSHAYSQRLSRLIPFAVMIGFFTSILLVLFLEFIPVKYLVRRALYGRI